MIFCLTFGKNLILVITKQKKVGICVPVEVKNQQRYVMNLFWYNNKYSAYGGYFKDNLRQHIFDVYEVYGYDDNSPDKKKLLNTCDLCNRTDDVVYYKKIQKACMKGFVKDELR